MDASSPEVIVGLMTGDSESFLSQEPDWTPSYGTNDHVRMIDLFRAAGVVVTLLIGPRGRWRASTPGSGRARPSTLATPLFPGRSSAKVYRQRWTNCELTRLGSVAQVTFG